MNNIILHTSDNLSDINLSDNNDSENINSTDINSPNDNKLEFLCIICNNLLVSPRIYESCGHTLCEECMIKNDRMDEKNNRYVFEATNYKCPLCRSITLTPWYSRPLNHFLISILEQNQEYILLEKKRKEAREKYSDNLKNYNSLNLNKINFSQISSEYRRLRATRLYKYILPIIYEAVLDAKPFIVIKDKARELRAVSDLISQKLIKNNNVYCVTSTNTEFTVEITPGCNKLKYNYMNDNYTENIETIENIENIENSDIDDDALLASESDSIQNVDYDGITTSSNTYDNTYTEYSSNYSSNFAIDPRV
jgi:hypothetical protein